jgi:hypothetical protein
METDNNPLEDALSFAQYQSTLSQQRHQLKQKFESDCIVAYNGGLFKITQEWLGSFDKNLTWALDMKGNPVMIANPEDLYNLAAETYKQALYEYGEEFQKLRTLRSVKLLVGL